MAAARTFSVPLGEDVSAGTVAGCVAPGLGTASSASANPPIANNPAMITRCNMPAPTPHSRMTLWTQPVQHDFRPAHAVVGGHAQRLHELAGNLRLSQTLDLAALVTDEMWMKVLGTNLRIAQGIQPRAIFAAHAVHELFAGKRVERAIDGDGIDALQLRKDLRDAQGARPAHKDFEHRDADRGPPQSAAAKPGIGRRRLRGHSPMISCGAGVGISRSVGHAPWNSYDSRPRCRTFRLAKSAICNRQS